jgi:hypothetical protein
MVRQNLKTKGSGNNTKINLWRHQYEVTLIELLLNKVQWHPGNRVVRVQIIRGQYKVAFQQALLLQYICLAF